MKASQSAVKKSVLFIYHKSGDSEREFWVNSGASERKGKGVLPKSPETPVVEGLDKDAKKLHNERDDVEALRWAFSR
jgi:hypothetical protein